MSPRRISAKKQPRIPIGAIVAGGGIKSLLEKAGRLPPVSLKIKPIETFSLPVPAMDRFLSYRFSSSVLVPVDSFEFTATWLFCRQTTGL